MNAKSLIVILGLGVGSFIVMGLMTKWLFDSSPALRNVMQFKVALAEEVRPYGLGEVSMRRVRGRSGYEIVLRGAAPADSTRQAALDAEVADFFLENFKSKRRTAKLQLTYVPVGAFGCSESTPYHHTEISLHALRTQKAEEARRDSLARAFEEKLQCRLLDYSQVGREIQLDLQLAGEEAPKPQELDELVRRLVAATRAHVRFKTMRLALRLPPDGALFAEGSIDPRGRFRRIPEPPPPDPVEAEAEAETGTGTGTEAEPDSASDGSRSSTEVDGR